jgi:4-hydroxy-3-polyprenylbenzoate decarboxylase
VTPTGWDILAAEVGDGKPPASIAARQRWLGKAMDARRPARLYADDDFRIPFASGSNPPDAVIVAPCSMGTLGRIAHGTASSVLTRCADVALKEKKPLILVPRETPLSQIHLENMLTLARAGADIVPACPGFYNRPATVRALVDFVVSRVLARLGIDADLHPKWGEKKKEPQP